MAQCLYGGIFASKTCNNGSYAVTINIGLTSSSDEDFSCGFEWCAGSLREVVMGELKRDLYPELDKILWDFRYRMIPADVAFKLYEARWGFVDRKHMIPQEKLLINKLVSEYGHGFFMPAA